jgi:predicted ribosomally synthesized peptide with SipW-like signal peptide
VGPWREVLKIRGHPVHRSTNRIVSIVAAVVSLVVVSLLVTRASNAAFTDTTESSNNSFSAGSIDLVDDDADVAMFTVSDLVPGDDVQECIEVTYQGSVADPTGVELYSGGLVDSGLAPHLDVVIEEGAGGDSASCAGFTSSSTAFTGTLTAFDSTHDTYATGVGSWDPSGTPESRTYRVTVTLGNDTPNSAQGDDAEVAFTWEAQS